ncbi:unnamed protein product [Blepharisma stoltei]|uniref:Uncharacterized protein n=1 Tax=Blepharisma stoltei TaxID=1481888 RepID=A0AAU9IXP6_9CILI|nr:unnamed protein product [Blepharisma stoltei]
MEPAKPRYRYFKQITPDKIMRQLSKLEPIGAAQRRIFASSRDYDKAQNEILETQRMYNDQREKILSKLNAKFTLPSLTPDHKNQNKNEFKKRKLDKSFTGVETKPDICVTSPLGEQKLFSFSESPQEFSTNGELERPPITIQHINRIKRFGRENHTFLSKTPTKRSVSPIEIAPLSPKLKPIDEVISGCDSLVNEKKSTERMLPMIKDFYNKPLMKLKHIVDAIDSCKGDPSEENVKEYRSFQRKVKNANNRIIYDNEFWEKVNQENTKLQANILKNKRKFWKQTSEVLPKELDNPILDWLYDRYI